jgi:hypothetical protein
MMVMHKTLLAYVIYSFKFSMKVFVAGASGTIGGPLIAE